MVILSGLWVVLRKKSVQYANMYARSTPNLGIRQSNRAEISTISCPGFFVDSACRKVGVKKITVMVFALSE